MIHQLRKSLALSMALIVLAGANIMLFNACTKSEEKPSVTAIGKIVDNANNPIVSANVSVGDKVSTTDNSGLYQIVTQPGSYIIKVTAQGYTPYSESLSIPGSGSYTIPTITLTPSSTGGGTSITSLPGTLWEGTINDEGANITMRLYFNTTTKVVMTSDAGALSSNTYSYTNGKGTMTMEEGGTAAFIVSGNTLTLSAEGQNVKFTKLTPTSLSGTSWKCSVDGGTYLLSFTSANTLQWKTTSDDDGETDTNTGTYTYSNASGILTMESENYDFILFGNTLVMHLKTDDLNFTKQ